MRQRIVICLLIIVPLILFFVAREKASWRPRIVATDELGDLRCVSNDSLFFTSNEEKHTSFHILTFDGHLDGHIVKKDISSEFYVKTAAFIAPDKIAIWEETGDIQLQCRVYDSSTLKQIKCLEFVELSSREYRDYWAEDRAKAFVNGQRILYVNPFWAYEWNLKTGRLTHRWKLQRPNDDSELTTTTYDAKHNTFVQIMAGDVRIWDAKTGRLRRIVQHKLDKFDVTLEEGDGPSDVEFSQDAQFLAYDNDATGLLSIARSSDAKKLWSIPNKTNAMSSFGHGLNGIEFTSDSKELFIWNQPTREFIIHDAPTRKTVRLLKGPATLEEFWLTPDNNWIYTLDDRHNLWRQRAR